MLFLDTFPPRPMCLLEDWDSCGDIFFFFVYPRVGGRSNAVLPTANEKISTQWELWRSVKWRKMNNYYMNNYSPNLYIRTNLSY